MLFSRLPRRIAIATVLLGFGAALAACSFSPVYSDVSSSSQARLEVAYAKPNNRLEQIIYQELGLRLGSSSSPKAGMVTVAASTQGGDVMLSATNNPRKSAETTVTATLTLKTADRPALQVTRKATAGYTRSGQILADQAAATEAGERAALSVAEALRLAVLASLTR
jgi:hypothetical protein